jgi:Na+/H+ antiporter NhaD/arsenite permease-like protein
MSFMAMIVFSATFIWLASERTPRHIVVLSGSAVMILLGLVSIPEAFRSIDWSMLAILLCLFIVVGLLSEWNVFNFLGAWLIRITRGNRMALFFMLPVLAAVLSMALNNIAVMLFLAVLTQEICREAQMDPAILITLEVCAANAGGSATMIGSAPNLIMGTEMHYSFYRVFAHMGPFAAAAGLLILLVYFVIHGKMLHGSLAISTPNPARWIRMPNKLLTKVVKRLDWETLLFFVGLFILVGALEKAGVFRLVAQVLLVLPLRPILLSLLFMALAAVVSAFVDNVPMALAMAYLIKNMHSMPGAPPEGILVWASLIGLTLGGNLSPIGASPNIVAYSVMERSGTPINWKRWFRLTAPGTLVALIAVSIFLWVKYQMSWY